MKNKLSLLFLVSLLVSIFYLYVITDTTRQEREIKPKLETKGTVVAVPVKEENKLTVSLADKIIKIAKSSEGLPYKAGGTTKKGFDCSGLVMTSFAKEGIELPRASYQMATRGKEVSLKEVQKGDLVFFKTNKDKPAKVSHVGLVTSVDSGEVFFIHSTTQKGVIISSTNEDYYKETFCFAKRVL